MLNSNPSKHRNVQLVKPLKMNTLSKPIWAICFILCISLAVTPKSVKADNDGHSGSSGGGGGAVLGLVLAGLVTWAIFGKNSESKKNKSDDVQTAPSTADNKEKIPQKKGIGGNLDPEF